MRFQLPQALLVFLGVTSTVIACDLHQHLPRDIPVQTLNGPHVRRSDVDDLLDRRAEGERDWTYEGQKTWGDIKPGMLARDLHLPRRLTKPSSVRDVQDRQAAIANRLALQLRPGDNA